MGTVLMAVGGVMGLVGGVIILIAAFQEGIGEGLLCLCIPFYILYFAIARFESERKGTIIAVWLGGGALYAIGEMIAKSGGG